MTDQILKKLEDHDEKFDELGQKLDSVTQKVGEHDKQLETIAKTVATNQERLGGVESRLDKMDQKMDNFVTKEDHQEVMGTLDELVGLAKKKDEELTFMGERVKGVESKAEKNTADIHKIKPLVGLETS